MRKERFLNQRKSKLQAHVDDPFQVLEKINDSANKVDLLGKDQVSETFNEFDLSPFDVGANSRTNILRNWE